MVREAMDEAAGQAIRAGQIVRRLRDFMSHGETERRVKGEGGRRPSRTPREVHPDEEAAIGRAEDAFERALGHEVRVSTSAKGLTVRITFEDLDELLRMAGSLKRS